MTKEIVKKYYDSIPDLIEEMHRNSAALGWEGVQRIEVDTVTKEVFISQFAGGQSWHQDCKTLFILDDFDWLFEISAEVMKDQNLIISEFCEGTTWAKLGRVATEEEQEEYGMWKGGVRVIDREEAYDSLSFDWMNECIEEAQTAYDEIFEQQEEDEE